MRSRIRLVRRCARPTTVDPTFTIATSATDSLSIKAHGSSVQVIIEVTGYYLPQIEAIISSTRTSITVSTWAISSGAEVAIDLYCSVDVTC